MNTPQPTATLDLDRAPMVIFQSRRKAALLFAASIAFVAIAVFMLRSGNPADRGPGWIGLALFGVGAPLFATRLARPGRLTLTPQGISQRNLWRTRTFGWDEVDRFRPWKVGGTTFVAFDDLRPEVRPINGAAGAQAILDAGWTLPPEPLADLLNRLRQRYAKG